MNSITKLSEISSGLCVLKFGATWCGPCKRLNPIVEKLAGEFTDIVFQAVDVDEGPEVGKQFSVRSVPTLVFLRDGKEVDRVIGMSLIDPLRKKLRDLQGSQGEEQ